MQLHQDARVLCRRCVDGDEAVAHALAAGRRAYVHVARGEVEVNGADSAPATRRIEDETAVTLARGRAAEVLLFDLP